MASMPDTGVELGLKYKDPITGFEGVCTQISYFMHGCARCTLETGVTDEKTGAITSKEWWGDTDRIKNHEVVEEVTLEADVIPTKSEEVTGGPLSDSDPGYSRDPGR